jgi:hypothetical protein
VARKPGIELEGVASDFPYSCRAVGKAKEGGLWDLKTKIMNQADPLPQTTPFLGENMKPDAIIKVRFKTTAEGGRQGPIIVDETPYGCPLFVEGEAFDCRLLVSGQTLRLGAAYELPVKFLSPHLALSKLFPGKTVTLWEGKEIATGEVVRLV